MGFYQAAAFRLKPAKKGDIFQLKFQLPSQGRLKDVRVPRVPWVSPGRPVVDLVAAPMTGSQRSLVGNTPKVIYGLRVMLVVRCFTTFHNF